MSAGLIWNEQSFTLKVDQFLREGIFLIWTFFLARGGGDVNEIFV